MGANLKQKASVLAGADLLITNLREISKSELRAEEKGRIMQAADMVAAAIRSIKPELEIKE